MFLSKAAFIGLVGAPCHVVNAPVEVVVFSLLVLEGLDCWLTILGRNLLPCLILLLTALVVIGFLVLRKLVWLACSLVWVFVRVSDCVCLPVFV